jgi:hypothetical protein
MKTVVLLAAILGQCSGGRCPAPTRYAPSFPEPSVIAQPSIHVVDQPVIRVVERPALLVRRWVREYGLRFEVIGTLTSAGKINWDPDLEFNRRSIAAARVAPYERRPAARIVDEHAAQPTAKSAAIGPEIQNFGLSPDKMGRRPDSYTAESSEAQRFVQEAKGESGDGGKLHVTVIGSESECATVVKDLHAHPALASVRDRLLIQDYRPSEWPVDPKLGFQGNGTPTILVQSARGPADPKGGKVLYRAMSYEGGPERLAEEIRKADPNYNPNLDPGPDRPSRRGCPLGFTHDHWLLIVGALVVVFIIFSKPKVQS